MRLRYLQVDRPKAYGLAFDVRVAAQFGVGGYLAAVGRLPEKPGGKALCLELDQKCIPFKIIHTSGHAGVHDLRRLAAAVASKALVPIHTAQPRGYREIFRQCQSSPRCRMVGCLRSGTI